MVGGLALRNSVSAAGSQIVGLVSERARIPSPVNPLQAQTEFERRAYMEDIVAHIIAIILTSGFFMLAFAALLGFVNISNAATATFLGTTMGYAVGQFHPILSRYFQPRNNVNGKEQTPIEKAQEETKPV